MPERAAAVYRLTHCTVSVNVWVHALCHYLSGMFYSREDGTAPRRPAPRHYGNRSCGAPSHRMSGLEMNLVETFMKGFCGSVTGQ